MNDQTRWKKSPWGWFAFLQLIIFAFLGISAVSHKSTVSEPLRLYVYQLCVWFLVGFTLVQILSIETKHLNEIVALSYALGAIVSLLTYFICMVTIGRSAVLYVSLLEIAASIWYLYKKRTKVLPFSICLLPLRYPLSIRSQMKREEPDIIWIGLFGWETISLLRKSSLPRISDLLVRRLSIIIFQAF